jgi:hypothetical protein
VRSVLDDAAERERLEANAARWAWHNGIYRPSERHRPDPPSARDPELSQPGEEFRTRLREASDRLFDVLDYLTELEEHFGGSVEDSYEDDEPEVRPEKQAKQQDPRSKEAESRLLAKLNYILNETSSDDQVSRPVDRPVVAGPRSR